MRKHLTYGNVIATLALFIALGGSAIAANAIITRSSQVADGVITGRKLANGSVSNGKVKRGSLGADRLSRSARASLTGQRGATGATGPAGPQGPAGTAGAQGAAGTALAYAQVQVAGRSALVDARTSGFTGVARPADGTYCLTVADSIRARVFDARGDPIVPTIATPEYGNTSRQGEDITVYGRGANSICGPNLIEVHTFREGAERDDVAFSVVLP